MAKADFAARSDDRQSMIAATLLAALPFSRARRATRREIAASATCDAFVDGTKLFTEGGPRTTIDVLAHGRACVERRPHRPSEPAVKIAYRGAHDVLDTGSFGAAGPRDATAIGIERGLVVRVPIAAFRAAEVDDAALSTATFALLAGRVRELEDRAESLLLRTVEGRLADFLVRAAARWGVPSPRGTLISLPLTHLEIARFIGSTRETVTLTLGALRRSGLMDVAGRRLIVCDPAALAARH